MKTTILPIVFLLSTTILRAENGVGNHNISPLSQRACRIGFTLHPAVRNILSTQLPARLQSSIKTKYSTYWITDLYKCTTEGKVCYYITLENADQKLKLNTSHGTNWQITRVVSKDVASR